VYSCPSLSGDIAVWCSARTIAAPAVAGVRIGSKKTLEVAAGYGAPVVSGGLVVWATSDTGPFAARGLSGGEPGPVAVGLSRGRLTAIALAGRTLVWGQTTGAGSAGVIATADVDGGDTRTVAAGVAGLAGSAFDGTTVLWAERDGGASPASAQYRVMGRRLGGGTALVVARVQGSVSEVAVSGHTAAWITSSRGIPIIETKELPR
jgi:hypothetical protein